MTKPLGYRHHHGLDSTQARRRMQRIAEIRAMRADGVTPDDMADRLAISPATLRNFVDMYCPPRMHAACPAICQAWEQQTNGQISKTKGVNQ